MFCHTPKAFVLSLRSFAFRHAPKAFVLRPRYFLRLIIFLRNSSGDQGNLRFVISRAFVLLVKVFIDSHIFKAVVLRLRHIALCHVLKAFALWPRFFCGLPYP